MCSGGVVKVLWITFIFVATVFAIVFSIIAYDCISRGVAAVVAEEPWVRPEPLAFTNRAEDYAIWVVADEVGDSVVIGRDTVIESSGSYNFIGGGQNNDIASE